MLRIGGLDIENRLDRVIFNGDLVLTRDHAGLALAKELQALEEEKALPEAVALKAA